MPFTIIETKIAAIINVKKFLFLFLDNNMIILEGCVFDVVSSNLNNPRVWIPNKKPSFDLKTPGRISFYIVRK